MSGIGVIHNPFARGNMRRPGVIKKIRDLVDDVGELWETRNVNELPRVAEDFLRKKLDILAVNGGDGTLHIVLSAFVKVYGDHPLPKVMSLRGGTMNTMSNSLGIKGRTVAIMKAAVEKYRRAEPMKEMKQNLLKINDKFGFMSGAGLVSNLLDDYYSAPVPGPMKAVKIMFQGIGSAMVGGPYSKMLLKPAPIRLHIDGKQLPQESYSGILGCTIKQIGLGIQPTFRAYDKPDAFHFIATDISPLKFAVRIPMFWTTRDWVHPNVQHSGVTKEVVVEPLKPIRWTVDGEMYTATEPLHFSVGPTLSVVTP